MRAIASGALTIALSLVTSHAMAAAYGTAGCGLGSIAIGPKPGMMQVVAATLNMTGVQTFGITTGTSNCKEGDEDGDKDKKDKPKKGKKEKKTGSVQQQKDFVANNLSTLRREAAQGGGDSLAGARRDARLRGQGLSELRQAAPVPSRPDLHLG